MPASPKSHSFNFNLITLAVLIVFGISFMSFAIFQGIETVLFIQKAYKTEGKVIERIWQKPGKHGGYSPRIEFYDHNGIRREFTPRDTTISPSLWGDTYSVLFDPQNPSEARINTFISLWLRILGPFCIALLSFTVGAWTLYGRCRRKRIITWLKSFGDVVHTNFAHFEKLELIEKSSKSAWRIISTWRDPETGKDYEFKSDDIWTPKGETPVVGVKIIDVYINPKNPKQHHMDTSFLRN